MTTSVAVIVLAAIGAVMVARRSSFVVPEGFYGLLYRHGKSLHRLSPGRHCFWHGGYTVRLIDMRKITLNIASQQVLSADNVGLKLDAALTYQIIQAETAMHEVQDYAAHLQMVVQLAVRSVIGATPLECLLRQRFDIGKQLLARVEPEADRLGIVIHALEIKEVVLRGELNKVFAEN